MQENTFWRRGPRGFVQLSNDWNEVRHLDRMRRISNRTHKWESLTRVCFELKLTIYETGRYQWLSGSSVKADHDLLRGCLRIVV
jgi:hypothetical protein